MHLVGEVITLFTEERFPTVIGSEYHFQGSEQEVRKLGSIIDCILLGV